MPALTGYAGFLYASHMIDIRKALGRMPRRGKFCSLAELDSAALALKADPRFKVGVAGRSALGRPIYHIRCGSGGLKVLVVGYPHPNEPVGGLSVLALLSLLKERPALLAPGEVEWHIVPCAAPDGAALTEAWTLRPFSFERFMRHYFRKDPRHDIESSFPVSYGTLKFARPVPETRALMRVLRAAKPDLYYSLHNTSSERAFVMVGRNFGRAVNARLTGLLKACGIPVSADPLPMAVKTYAKGVFSEILIRAEYDSLKKTGEDPARYIKSGATPVEYLRAYNAQAISLLCELPHVKRAAAPRGRGNARRRRLRSAADGAYFASVLAGEWLKVKGEVNRESPFYSQVAARMPARLRTLRTPALPAGIFSDASLDRAPAPGELEEDFLRRYYELCGDGQFAGLLRDSRQTPAVKAALARVEALLEEFYGELAADGAFKGFRPIAPAALARAQLGCGLIVINSLLKARKRKLS